MNRFTIQLSPSNAADDHGPQPIPSLRLDGQIDQDSLNEVMTVLGALHAHGERKIILDLTAVTQLSLSGLTGKHV